MLCFWQDLTKLTPKTVFSQQRGQCPSYNDTILRKFIDLYIKACETNSDVR